MQGGPSQFGPALFLPAPLSLQRDYSILTTVLCHPLALLGETFEFAGPVRRWRGCHSDTGAYRRQSVSLMLAFKILDTLPHVFSDFNYPFVLLPYQQDHHLVSHTSVSLSKNTNTVLYRL